MNILSLHKTYYDAISSNIRYYIWLLKRTCNGATKIKTKS